MTYALLIYRLSDAAPEPNRDGLAGHRAVQAEAAGRGQLHAVARLGEPTAARTVRRGGARHDVTDGPLMETKEWLVGFYLVDCDDEAQALERARGICGDAAHAIEVRPVDWRWRG